MPSEVEQLKQALASLKQEMLRKTQALDARINALEPISAPLIVQPDAVITDTTTSTWVELDHQIADQIDAELDRQADAIMADAQAKKAQPAVWFVLLKSMLLSLFGPFSSLLEQILDTYQSYKAEGKGPAFLMTLVGILTLVVGFGFLLQYAFQHFLGDISKVIISFSIANAVVLLGIKIAKKHPEMQEYSGGIIGLGIIFNYLCAYFTTAHFQLFGVHWGFSLLVLITLLAYGLAAYFETRVVAVLTLIGGATTPLFLGDMGQISLAYFAYLGFLVVTMLRLSYQIRWVNLMQLALVMVIGMTEYLVLNDAADWLGEPWYLAYLHGLFYAFLWTSYQFIRRAVSNALIVSLMSANLVFFIFTLYQSVPTDMQLGWIFIANALFLLLGLILHQKWTLADASSEATISSIVGLHIALLLGFGVLYLLDPVFLGMVWGVESLLLLYLGIKFALPPLRYEGYTAFLIALVYAVMEALPWIHLNLLQYSTSIDSIHYDIHWMNLIVFGVMVWTATRLLGQASIHSWEQKAHYWLQEVFSLWLSLAFMFSLMAAWYPPLLLASILPIFVLLARAKRHQLPLTETLALLHYGLFILQILFSADQAASFSFRDQDWVGKVVRIEAFITLWLIAEFYARYYPKGLFFKFAQTLRIVFYLLIPLGLLAPAWRHLHDFFPMILWLSAATSLGLFYKLGYRALKVEFIVLTGLAWLSMILSSGLVYIGEADFYAGFSLLTGLLFFSAVMILGHSFSHQKKYQRQWKDYRLLPVWGLYYLATVIFVVSYGYSGDLSLAFTLVAVYLFALSMLWPHIVPVNKTLGLSYVGFVSALCVVDLIYWLDTQGLGYLLLLTVLIGILLHYRQRSSVFIWHILPHSLQLWLFNLFLLHVYYELILDWFYQDAELLVSMAMVLHATVILLLTLKPRFIGLIRLSIGLFGLAALKILLFDMDGFSLIQKVIAFMVIGSVLLGASYLYQRLLQHRR